MKDPMILPFHMLKLRKLAVKSRMLMDYQVDEGTHRPVWFIAQEEFALRLNVFFGKAVK